MLKFSGMSETRYTVDIDGSVRRYYDTPELAVSTAAMMVYLGRDRQAVVAELAEGRPVSWSYGFQSVTITPPGLPTP